MLTTSIGHAAAAEPVTLIGGKRDIAASLLLSYKRLPLTPLGLTHVVARTEPPAIVSG